MAIELGERGERLCYSWNEVSEGTWEREGDRERMKGKQRESIVSFSEGGVSWKKD